MFYEVDGESKVIDDDFLHDVYAEGDKGFKQYLTVLNRRN